MTKIAAMTLALALMAGPIGHIPVAAAAGQGESKPAADWLPVDQIRKGLMSAGYTEITKMEVDDGHWDGEGVKNGRRMKFEVDPKSGAILGEMEQ
ncbi:hypothetical protein OCOJLMKI_1096 [Methylobacterium iners]|uniref:PepSY domain-containing protein n=2 Tax=Methylobacterium iners TaxID=418707 RepID=A0ABQ4RUQ1_9HYPH|nr:hypothetical protein OCOJLMKI_1096 [Methylobacterium iners]